jgi:hypothetical protein
MAHPGNPPHAQEPAQLPDFAYRPRVPGGVEDRLDEVLGHEGNPYESNYEAMVEALQALRGRVGPRERSRRCGVCNGTGVRELTAERLAQRTERLDRMGDDMRRTESEQHRDRLAGDKRKELERLSAEGWCSPCNGTGWIHGQETKPLADMLVTRRCEHCRGSGEKLNEELQDYCPRCTDESHLRLEGGGEACYVPVTAKPHARSIGGGSWSGASSTDNPLDALPYVSAKYSEIEPEKVYEYGRIQRAVRVVREENSVLAAAIETYYGPSADRWKLHPWGKRFALWPLTDGGKKLIRESETAANARFLPVDVIASERQAEEASRITPELASLATQRKRACRRALIRQADCEARGLEARMLDRIRRIEL